MPDLTRDVLIDAVRDEISGWPIGHGYYQTIIGTDEAGELAHVVVDAVLRLVADDLDAYALDEDCDCQTDSDVTTCDCIRSLLPSTEGDQP